MSGQTELFNDEVSFSDIILKLWLRRGLLVILPILSGAVGIFSVLFLSVQSNPPIVHYISLTGIEKGSYPNGVAFSPRDLQSPEVLQILSKKFGITGAENFDDSIDVSYAAPTTSGILKKYQAKLSEKKLRAAEIDAINEEFSEELKNASQKTAQIAINYNSIGVDESLAAQMAIALPTVWAEVFTTKFRVLDSTQLSGLTRIKKLSLLSSSGVLEASDYIEGMLRGLSIIEADSRLSGLQTDSGKTSSDLLVRVEDFNNLYLSAIMSHNLGSADALTKFYQSDIGLRIVMVNEQINGITGAIASIQSVISGEANLAASGPNVGSGMQVTGDAIGGIVDLVNQSSLSSYLTGLYEEKKDLIKLRSELNLRLSKIEKEVDYGDTFLIEAEDRINELNKEYIEILGKAREMNRQNNKTLSQAIGSPHRAGSIIPKRGILIIMLFIVAGGFAAIVIALLAPGKPKTKS